MQLKMKLWFCEHVGIGRSREGFCRLSLCPLSGWVLGDSAHRHQKYSLKAQARLCLGLSLQFVLSGETLKVLKEAAKARVQHSSSETRFKYLISILNCPHMRFVVLEDICGLSVRNRDKSSAPHSTFPLQHVQVAPGCSLRIWHFGGV